MRGEMPVLWSFCERCQTIIVNTLTSTNLRMQPIESKRGGHKDRHAQEISLSAQNALVSLLLSRAGNLDIINASILGI
jgi:hypothetical protein